MTLNDKLIENIDNKFKKFAKWVFPLKAAVVNLNESRKITKEAKLVKNLSAHDLMDANLSSVGYVHFKLREVDLPDGKQRLEVACGISFCDPEDYFNDYNPVIGKQIAKDYTRFKNDKVYDGNKEIPAKQISIDCYYNRFNDGSDLGIWQYYNENNIPTHMLTYSPNFTDYGYFFHKVYDEIIVMYNFSMRESQLLTMEDITTNDGFSYIRYHGEAFMWQVKYYLNGLIGRYISTKYKDIALAYKEEIIDNNTKKVKQTINPSTLVKVKNNTVIIPIEVEVEKYKSLSRAGRVNQDNYDRSGHIETVGYIAIRFEDKKWYCGVSYCNPEDLLNGRFSAKHGRKLAYARMMKCFEDNKSGGIPWILERINFHNFDNIPNFHYQIENGVVNSVAYRYVYNVEDVRQYLELLAGYTGNSTSFVNECLITLGFDTPMCLLEKEMFK